MILWFVWKDRNAYVHGERAQQSMDILQATSVWFHEFQKIRFQQPTVSCAQHWRAPAENLLKLNVEASVIPGRGRIGVGGVIRDSSGFVLGAFSKLVSGNFSPFAEECLGRVFSLLKIVACGSPN